jgi:hypothetical protein
MAARSPITKDRYKFKATKTTSRSEAYAQRNDALREAFLKPFEFAASAPPTSQTIPEACKQAGIEHYVHDLYKSTGHPARLHWLGERSARKTLLYFHGT